MLVSLTALELGIAHSVCSSWATSGWNGSSYTRGILNTPKEPRKAERIGIQGEIAAAKMLGTTADLSYKEGGDEADFVLRDKQDRILRVDVKVQHKDYDVVWIRRQGYRGVLALKDLYLFGRDRGTAVEFIGAASRSTIEGLGDAIIKQSRHPMMDHMNYEIPLHLLTPMETVLDWYDANFEPEGFQVCY